MESIRSAGTFTQNLQGTMNRSSETPQPAGPQDRIELSRDRERLVEKDAAVLKKTIEQLPKVDIHRHLEGAIKPETVLAVAQKYGIELPATTLETLKPLVCVNENDKTLGDFLKKFSILSKLFINPDAIREISMNCVLDAQKENVKAMELRFNPFSMARAGNLDPHQVMDAVIEGVRKGEKETGMTVALTTIIPRNKGPETGAQMEELTQEYVKKGQISYEQETAEGKAGPGNFGNVTAIDLANDEANFPADPFAPVFMESENDGIHRTVHAGEARGAESVRTAIEDCHAERIGHGIRAFEDPSLVQNIIAGNIPLEMCPTSNVQTGAIQSIESHPLKKFYDMGGRATINTDDPGVCDTDLNQEYMKAIKGIGCTLRDVEQMIVYSVDAMFLPPPIKAALHATMVAEINRVNRGIGK